MYPDHIQRLQVDRIDAAPEFRFMRCAWCNADTRCAHMVSELTHGDDRTPVRVCSVACGRRWTDRVFPGAKVLAG